MRKKVVSTKLLKKFGWSSKKNLKDGLKEAIDYYINYYLKKQKQNRVKDAYLRK
jgi:dTDP-D-glucose 4,6-dehydratase